MDSENRAPSYFRNWISVIGIIFSIIMFVTIASLFLLDFLFKVDNPYLGIVTYMVAPAFLIFSLILILVGAWIERTQRHKRGYVRRFPVIDFNNPTHQKWMYTAWGVITMFLLFSAIGIYRVYNFTESNTFCGRICHTVMKPEYTVYHNSSHARVTCVQCHIGHGAEWYVRSKLSGAYQVYSVLANRFSRPIETPIKNLRPAQETCEQCHWPQQFYGAVEQDHHYFLPDETNTQWKTRMLMFVGGGTPPYGKREGIHWHMNISNKVYYIATDEKRQTIPWVRRIGMDGKEEIFVDEESGYTAQNPPKGELRTMDCMDCHNRPSHIFKSPTDAVNEAMTSGTISASLPYIKREAVKALVGKYASDEEGVKKIQNSLEGFYQKKYPLIWSGQKDKIDQAIKTIVGLYQMNFYPEMNVSWKVYPENIGHFISPGCFRCHSGRHKTADGRMIATDCTSCHAIIAQGAPGAMETKVEGLEFKHPDQAVGEAWKDMPCFDCHTGDIA
ncbi:MAG: hypothetical protein A3G33_10520 [Omnitrophica bacterium RIFCSPLOWO2_12_FULL_44_17]|uniref:NapC/NirT cytochrome c N-terminal domain-containing protein n=1 Tax=Candidatus Danuiimicrobium aquiferis TaxID=1801832 RepID=A0A1G1KR47_9BACT|nr:MAG: hypothetical protein A3B72_02835 [Omnitrophica bacterium RIFCSPHIGHO2_02_FULL_45_28]OGW88436.1 MAG: hypothetical protein A3E74_08195 [Omnitrophica bacterium RIFCSPHIGHO2_12_FULL_44_12]OGW95406.1 MAG: hypothetical protein A3G33_10520 [Omnitrophica bacterium RIFCSPLOWO2_12_FULL_44_17]OGX03288.1 MAG: hypothetical protein A3J12_07150 [Omnitrophica bacterium RIFCSPLOWO2_02_FULL_44_11]